MARIHLIAPSGYCLNQDAAWRGVRRLEEAGLTVDNQQVITRRMQRFAGRDDERLGDLQALSALSENDVIVMPVRGGYGMTRLLDTFDPAPLIARQKENPLLICGHSDFTALQMRLLARGNTITFSGPMLAGNFGAPEMNDFTWRHFWQALTEPEFTLAWRSDGAPCAVAGTVWGGNLAMLASITGTPWMPQIDGGILVVEDINEHPFRVERMLLQLHAAGILARQKALILGSFTAAASNDYDDGYSLESVAALLRERLNIPVLTGLAFGHEQETVTLPLGAHGELRHDGEHAQLRLSGHPVLSSVPPCAGL
ncbi:muramoyltetrapeptide carboxypeptidase [Cronobacter muytjensii]|uniref:muramoyltetrapeptide carboxypeptidase n=1 Tax=Cronobacter muytjensii TaxID=413501 RepID=UPI0015881A31|nr:muramoyltetrapeptide carboxypeptidase [Cronobacter muytjensii]NUW61360.1 muramoyltetrapeptide carboxypeptidase [Cronobacter muytjensii]